MVKQNYLWIDQLRAVAIIAVVLVHVSSPVLFEYGKVVMSDWWVGNVVQGVTRFCVPIFFMITGALLLNNVDSLSEYFRKRFSRIIPPLIFWSIVYLLYNRLVVEHSSFTLLDFIKKSFKVILKGSHYHLWFVYVLIGIYLFIPVLKKWVKNSAENELVYFLGIWGGTILISVPILVPYMPNVDLTYFTGYIGYVVAGYYLSRVTIPTYLAAIGMLIGIGYTIIATYNVTAQTNIFSPFHYGYLTPNVVIASLGIFIFFKNISISNPIYVRVVEFLSKNSFGIYLMHILILMLLENFGLTWNFANPIISISVISFICLIVSGVCIHLIRSFKYGKYIAG